MSFMSIKKQDFSQLKVGDPVIRMMAGTLPMDLKVSKVSDTIIYCGPWEFDKTTGGEIDSYFGWDGKTVTGSFLRLPT